MPGAIDYDRGVLIRIHEKTGVDVNMYVDSPGVYLSNHGTPVSESLAAEAGFDVERHRREKIIRERTSEAEEAIRKELAQGEATRRVVIEKDGFKVLDLGLGRHQLLSPTGDVLTTQMLPLKVAQDLLEALTAAPSTSP